MRQMTSSMEAHISGEVSSLTWLVKISRTDGTILGFTTHDRDLTVDGTLYEAETAIGPTTIENQASAAPDNLQLDGVLSSDRIKESDLISGRYNGARLDIYRCNWRDVSMGVFQLGRYFIGPVTWMEGKFKADLLSLKDALSRVDSLFITERCRFSLGDAMCGIDVEAISVNTEVMHASGYAITVEIGGTQSWPYGTVEVLEGPMTGLRREIKAYDAQTGVLTLWEPFPSTPAVGLAIRMRPGCDRQASTCHTTYSNIDAMGGFPFVPGPDRTLSVPDAKY